MAITAQVILRNAAGAVVATFDQWLEFVIEREVNACGSYGFHINGDDPRVALFELDGQIEFWWTDSENGIALHKEFEAFHEDWDYYTDADGARHYVSMGRGYNSLLDRTVNNSKAGTAGASKDGPAETVIKAYVDEQAGPTAGARARSGLTIEADGAGGMNIDIQRAYRNLLEICQDVARIGDGDFQVVGTHAGNAGPATFEFRWYAGQLGTDRRASLIFAENMGNMTEPRLEVRRSHVRNAALVAAYGEGAARYNVWRTDAASIALSPWNRREVLVDAREVDDGNTDGAADKGDNALAENVMTTTFGFRTVQSPGCLYGKAYFLGDLGIARFGGVDYERKVQRVSMTLDRNGQSIEVETVSRVPHWWEVEGHICLAAYQPILAASYAASLVNLANPGTYDAVEIEAPLWDTNNGWKFKQSPLLKGKLSTGLVCGSGWTFVVRFTNAANIAALFGYYISETDAAMLLPNYNGACDWYYSGEVTSVPAYTAGVGVIAGTKAYMNGSDVGILLSGTVAAGDTLYLGGWKMGASFFRGASFIQAFAVYSGVLNAPEVAALSARMAAL